MALLPGKACAPLTVTHQMPSAACTAVADTTTLKVHLGARLLLPHPSTHPGTHAPSPPQGRRQPPSPVQQCSVEWTTLPLLRPSPSSSFPRPVSSSPSAWVAALARGWWRVRVAYSSRRLGLGRVSKKLYPVMSAGPVKHQNASMGAPACTSQLQLPIFLGKVADWRCSCTPPRPA